MTAALTNVYDGLTGVPLQYEARRYPRLNTVPPGVREWLGRWDAGTAAALILVGPTGSGKTTLAWEVALRVAGRLDPRAFVRVIRAADLAAAMRADDSEMSVRRLSSCSLLVVDDLGTARHTDWQAEHFDRIVDERWSRRRPFVLTSNVLNLRELLGDRVASRIADGAVTVKLTEQDRRRQGGVA